MDGWLLGAMLAIGHLPPLVTATCTRYHTQHTHPHTAAAADQRLIFKEPPRGIRKVVISTNIAETSITVNDVVYVIDSGKLKEKQYDATLQTSSLTEARCELRRVGSGEFGDWGDSCGGGGVLGG